LIIKFHDTSQANQNGNPHLTMPQALINCASDRNYFTEETNNNADYGLELIIEQEGE